MAQFGTKSDGRQVTVHNKKYEYDSAKGVWQRTGSVAISNSVDSLDVTGDITGNLLGNVTGTLTGDLSGNITSNVSISGTTTASGDILPSANATYDLGSSSNRWQNIYTSDLSLNNGIGDWTIVEGEDDLFLYNNKKNKVYKFALIEVDSTEATPKIEDLRKK